VYTGQCPVHQRTTTQTRHLREFLEALRYNSPDCPVYTGQCPVLQGSAASGTRQPREITSAAPLKFTGLSGEPRSNGYLRAKGHLQAHSMRARAAQSSGTPLLAHQTMNSTCPVCTGHPGGPRSQKLQRSESNGSDDVAGAPDCPVRPSPAASPMATKLDGGYKYHPNRPLQGVGVQATFQVI
jgi:hypothetical protein